MKNVEFSIRLGSENLVHIVIIHCFLNAGLSRQGQKIVLLKLEKELFLCLVERRIRPVRG